MVWVFFVCDFIYHETALVVDGVSGMSFVLGLGNQRIKFF
jgi:hypothetical protein